MSAIKGLPADLQAHLKNLDPGEAKKPPTSLQNSTGEQPPTENKTHLKEDQVFAFLMAGKMAEAGYDDNSRADFRLCQILARTCKGNRVLMDHMFRQSKLMRSKWDEKHGAQTYGEMTIAKALGTSETEVDVPDLQPWELHELIAAKIPPREALATLDNHTPILTTHSINQVVAWRGSGKTLFQQGWGIAMSCGLNFLCYRTTRPLRVLYVEGELPDAQLQERLSALSSGKDIPQGNFYLLSRDRQNALGMDIPSIHTEEGRLAIERAIERTGAEVLFLDSISSLLLLGTNDEERWLNVLPWLARLRSRGLCILLTQQTGKNQALGNRGHSRSEDALDLSIKLTPYDEECDHLHCKLEYTKIRGQRRGVQSLSIRYKGDWEGWTWTFFEQDLVDALRRLLEDDPKMSNVALAKELGVSRNRIPKLKKRLATVDPKQSSFDKKEIVL